MREERHQEPGIDDDREDPEDGSKELTLLSRIRNREVEQRQLLVWRWPWIVSFVDCESNGGWRGLISEVLKVERVAIFGFGQLYDNAGVVFGR